jgi:L-amino acid N-acyltransferase YncA
MPEFVIDAMQDSDWEDVRAIYREGIATGDATFEEEPPTWDEWNSTHLKSCRLVARADERVIAWAALSPVSNRECYRGVAEVALYVAAEHRGAGVGRALGKILIEAAEEGGVWTLQAMVFPENKASLALLEEGEFRAVGVRRRIGKHKGRWRDVVLLEKRSEVAGVD